MKFIKCFFSFILCLQAFWANAQTDAWEQMQAAHDRLWSENKSDSVIYLAKKMNKWAKKQKTDTSLLYAVSLRQVGSAYVGKNNDSALYYFNRSLKTLEKQKEADNMTMD